MEILHIISNESRELFHLIPCQSIVVETYFYVRISNMIGDPGYCDTRNETTYYFCGHIKHWSLSVISCVVIFVKA